MLLSGIAVLAGRPPVSARGANDVLARRPPLSVRSATDYLNTASFGPFGGGVVQEVFSGMGNMTGDTATLTLKGDNRQYLVEDTTQHTWSGVTYQKLDLLGKTLSVTVDVSNAGCGCNAALYLVAMGDPSSSSSNYCDIQSSSYCLEIDLLEANRKVVQTTLHTQHGTGMGSCNQWGCAVNWGKDSHTKYGQGITGGIDSARPFRMNAAVNTSGWLNITLVQDETT
jgi:hypothetical protein